MSQQKCTESSAMLQLSSFGKRGVSTNHMWKQRWPHEMSNLWCSIHLYIIHTTQLCTPKLAGILFRDICDPITPCTRLVRRESGGLAGMGSAGLERDVTFCSCSRKFRMSMLTASGRSIITMWLAQSMISRRAPHTACNENVGSDVLKI